MSTYLVYTDGAYSSARNQGGIGFVILKDGKEVARYSKMYKNSTNQRMEQMAAIVALESITTPSEVTIVSDSQYVVCTYTKGWKRKANLDLWKRFDAAIAFHIKVEFEWTKGHADNQYNKICDKLAQEASRTIEITD
jgi:ribonuclease H|nr:MAG TPA: ribonuclease HI [Caudoviricetes sp.]